MCELKYNCWRDHKGTLPLSFTPQRHYKNIPLTCITFTLLMQQSVRCIGISFLNTNVYIFIHINQLGYKDHHCYTFIDKELCICNGTHWLALIGTGKHNPNMTLNYIYFQYINENSSDSSITLKTEISLHESM